MLTMTLMVASMFTMEVLGQDSTVMSKVEYDRMDSIQTAYDREDAQTQKAVDLEKMTDAKSDRSETKAKLKEARRVEGEANDAAKQSRNALRAERKAQKARKAADKQADRAEDARNKSNQN